MLLVITHWGVCGGGGLNQGDYGRRGRGTVGVRDDARDVVERNTWFLSLPPPEI